MEATGPGLGPGSGSGACGLTGRRPLLGRRVWGTAGGRSGAGGAAWPPKGLARPREERGPEPSTGEAGRCPEVTGGPGGAPLPQRAPRVAYLRQPLGGEGCPLPPAPLCSGLAAPHPGARQSF